MTPSQFTTRLLQENPRVDAQPAADNTFQQAMRGYHWSLIETGGGATAFILGEVAGTHLLLEDEAQAPTDMSQPCRLSICIPDGEVCSFTDVTPGDAIELGKHWEVWM
jgi:hypothetical protein